MKKRFNHRLVILAVALIAGIALACGSTAKAGGYEQEFKNNSKQILVLSSTDKKNGYYFYSTKLNGATNLKVKSTKKSVAAVKIDKQYGEGAGVFVIKPKKAGTTKITITGKANGKKVTFKGTIKVVKFSQPFKSLKVDGKNYLKKVKSSANGIELYTSNDSFKVDYKVKSGWKVKRANTYSTSGSEKVKSGQNISISSESGVRFVDLELQNKKTKETIVTTIVMYRQ